MTYDPDRDARAPGEINPNRRPYQREGAGLSVAVMLALMAAFIAVGFWFYATQGETTVADPERPVTGQTTANGASPRERPLPETPTSPTVPSPPRQ